jgi:dihydrofolate reductase
LPRFKNITSGHPIIMGRKTFESIGKSLPGRTNIIVTRDIARVKNEFPFIEEVVSSVDEAIERAKASPGSDEIFIIGGGQIYHQAIDKVDRLYLTLVEGDFGADTFFPDYSSFTKVVSKEDREEAGYKYKFLTLEK